MGVLPGPAERRCFTSDAINTNGSKAVHEVADLIGQVHANNPDQAKELLDKTVQGIPPEHGQALHQAVRPIASPEVRDARNPSSPGGAPVNLDLAPALKGADGSEPLSISISGVPEAAQIPAVEPDAPKETPSDPNTPEEPTKPKGSKPGDKKESVFTGPCSAFAWDSYNANQALYAARQKTWALRQKQQWLEQQIAAIKDNWTKDAGEDISVPDAEREVPQNEWDKLGSIGRLAGRAIPGIGQFLTIVDVGTHLHRAGERTAHNLQRIAELESDLAHINAQITEAQKAEAIAENNSIREENRLNACLASHRRSGSKYPDGEPTS